MNLLGIEIVMASRDWGKRNRTIRKCLKMANLNLWSSEKSKGRVYSNGLRFSKKAPLQFLKESSSERTHNQFLQNEQSLKVILIWKIQVQVALGSRRAAAAAPF